MFWGKMFFDMGLEGKENHVDFRMPCLDRLLQFFQDGKSQFNALTISLVHDNVALFLLFPQQSLNRSDALIGEVPNAVVPLQVATQVVNYAVSNMIVV